MAKSDLQFAFVPQNPQHQRPSHNDRIRTLKAYPGANKSSFHVFELANSSRQRRKARLSEASRPSPLGCLNRKRKLSNATFTSPTSKETRIIDQEKDENDQTTPRSSATPTSTIQHAIVLAKSQTATSLTKLRSPYLASEYSSSLHHPDLSMLLEFYTRILGPALIWRSEMISSGDIVSFRTNFLQHSLSNPELLEILFALSQSQIDLSRDPSQKSRGQSVAVLRHKGRAIRGLRMRLDEDRSGRGAEVNRAGYRTKQSRLSTTDSASYEIALMIAVGLLVLDISYGDWTSAEPNLRGTRVFVARRGLGIDELGWCGLIQACLSWAETRWAQHMSGLEVEAAIAAAAVVKSRSPARPDAQSSTTLTYPTHPFPPPLCQTISLLPPHLRTLSLTSTLSTRVLSHLSSISTWSATYGSPSLTHTTNLRTWWMAELEAVRAGARVLGDARLGAVERVLCVGCMAWVVCTGVASDGRCNAKMHSRGVEEQLRGLGRLVAGWCEDEDESGGLGSAKGRRAGKMRRVVEEDGAEMAMLWSSVVLAGMDTGGVAVGVRREMLDELIRWREGWRGLSGEQVVEILKGFWWNEVMLERWRRVWEDALIRWRIGVEVERG